MLYTSGTKDFRHHVHPTLQKRIRMFLIMSAIMLAIVAFDIYMGTLSWWVALGALVVGGAVGFFTSRIFHLSWEHDGQRVVGRIDKIGWFVLGAYVVFEVIRASLFETVIHTGSATTAITFAFISAAFFARALGLRGRIVRILVDEKIFG